jgi:membrane-bound lytic murein transglycosylase D
LRGNLIRVGQELRIYSRQGVPRLERVSSRRRVSGSQRTSESSPPENETGGSVHIVRSGDSLWSLSRRYGVSVEALRKANPEIAREGLKAGEKIVIPKR